MPDQYAAFFKCFCAASRNRMLQVLAQHGELSVEEIAQRVGLKEPTVSRHLQLLRLHGVVEVRPDPPMHYYSLNGDVVPRRFADFLAFLGLTGSSGACGSATLGVKRRRVLG